MNAPELSGTLTIEMDLDNAAFRYGDNGWLNWTAVTHALRNALQAASLNPARINNVAVVDHNGNRVGTLRVDFPAGEEVVDHAD